MAQETERKESLAPELLHHQKNKGTESKAVGEPKSESYKSPEDAPRRKSSIFDKIGSYVEKDAGASHEVNDDTSWVSPAPLGVDVYRPTAPKKPGETDEEAKYRSMMQLSAGHRVR